MMHIAGVRELQVALSDTSPPSAVQAQRRFRERQKTKFVELNIRVEELEGVISELLSEKTKLEDRTSFLEKALECRSSSETDASAMPRSASAVSIAAHECSSVHKLGIRACHTGSHSRGTAAVSACHAHMRI